MNGGKETGASLGRNKTAQFSLTECLSNYLTQWKRSQNITAKYLWNKMYNSAGTWHAAWAPHEGLAIFDLTGAARGSVDGRPEPDGEAEPGGSSPRDRAARERGMPTHTEGRMCAGPEVGRCLSPSAEEVGTWMGCCWKDKLLATLNYLSQSTQILTHNTSMLLAMCHSLLYGGPMYENIWSSQELNEIGSIINANLQVRKLRHRKVK